MHFPVRRYLALLVTYLKPQWRKTLLMAALLLRNVGLQLLGPQILRYFIDTILGGGAASLLMLASLLYVGVTLADNAASIATTYLSETVAWTATNRLRIDLVAHCLSLDMGFHKAHTPGELIERIDGDVDALSNFFSQFVIYLLTNIVLLLGVLIALYIADWRAGLVMTTVTTINLLILLRIRSIATPRWVAYRQLTAEFFGFLGEFLAGTEDIRANGATGYVLRRFSAFLRPLLVGNRRAQMASAYSGVITLTLFIINTSLITLLGAYLWSIHAISVGTVYLFWGYSNLLSQPVQQIRDQLQDLQRAEACIQRVEQLLSTPSAIQDNPATAQTSSQALPPVLPSAPLSVAFQHVTFGYTKDTPVLHSLSFQVQPGHVLGVLGRTASGKTTLARLLFRLYNPQAGEILLNETAISALPLRELRQHIGLVTQDVQLFQASVRDNLAFFNQAIDDTRIREVIELVGLSPWLSTLPDGLDTPLGTGGRGLSAGEEQLLAFARVFLKNPGLVIFDEAASRLDPATERQVEQATTSVLAHRTGIVIAHRLATIQRADDILILEDGAIREYGTRASLAADPQSRFSQLLRTGLEQEARA